MMSHPVQESPPVSRAEEHEWKSPDLAGLDQRQRLEQFVKGAEAAREEDEPLGVLHEHGFAAKEVAKVDGDIDIRIDALFSGQLDVATNGKTVRLAGPAVGRLHDTGATAGD